MTFCNKHVISKQVSNEVKRIIAINFDFLEKELMLKCVIGYNHILEQGFPTQVRIPLAVRGRFVGDTGRNFERKIKIHV